MHTHFTVRPELTVGGLNLSRLWRDLPMAEINAFVLDSFELPASIDEHRLVVSLSNQYEPR